MLLCAISIVEVYSASSTLTYRTEYWKPILRHSTFLLGGLGFVLLFHAIPPKFFSVFGVLLVVAWVLLLVTRFFGDSINGSSRWLDIGGISFQPSEIAKLCLIVLTAFLLSKRNEENDKKTFIRILVVTAVTCGIIFIDNGSTAILLFGIIILMMFIGQISLKRMGLLVLALVVFIALLYGIIKLVPSDSIGKVFPRAETWIDRFKDYSEDVNVHDPNFVITDDNYQVSHANIAISNGGVRIIGTLPGHSIERDFLPQAYSDFIYAIILEETGLLGGFAVLLLYVILFIRAGVIANRSEQLFPKYMVMGAAFLIVTQALANMAVAVGIIPVTGQPLPLVSRGGTSILITCIYFGIILSVSRYENPKGVEREEEIEEELNEAKEQINLVNEEES
jgi:cell division protein FtsW